MKSFNKLSTLTGWLMFAIAACVYILTAEPTTSLWDCGEFIAAADKLQVVHPPGAPLFLMIGRVFAWVAETFTSNPENVAYFINLMSGFATAALVMFVCWSTIILSKLSLVGRRGELSQGQGIAALASGVVAGLATTFATSIWFSAVEGEVYALSSGFTGLVTWAALKWYVSEDKRADKWLIFIAYMMGLSIGVHLLSLLVIPFIGVLFYFKKQDEAKINDLAFNVKGTVIGALGGLVAMMVVNAIVIPKLPAVAASFDHVFVNSIGLGLGTGVLFFILFLIGGIAAGLNYAHKSNNYYLHLGVMMFAMVLTGFSSYGVVVLRASANTPINMNKPDDPYSMLSYLNREQYGDRPLAYGPHYLAQPIASEKEKDVYGPVKQEDGSYTYEVVREKQAYVYDDADKMLFPRIGHGNKKDFYKHWLDLSDNDDFVYNAQGKAIGTRPEFSDNIGFFFNYQIGWMYTRYFLWNFAGRQNAKQGWTGGPIDGNWMSGIAPLDSYRLYNQSNLPKHIREHKGRNKYYLLPLVFGLIGLIFHFSKRNNEAMALLVLFVMTGLAIIVFSNQPPREPRERDYVLVGSIFTFCMWMGMAVPALYELFSSKLKAQVPSAALAAGLVLMAPIIMGAQNWDDHSRADHYAARDYAKNFLESVEQNAIIFTHGDNDTYPLWYAQEVEGIRKDVRVINFSLLAVDWYIDQLRRKVNESDKIEMTIPMDGYRGSKRDYLPVNVRNTKALSSTQMLKFMAESHPQNNTESYIPSSVISFPVDKAAARANGAIPADIPDSIAVDNITFKLPRTAYYKDDIALLDIVSTNAANGWKRPIYFAVTCRNDKIMGFKDYLQLEGMALRIVPVKTPVSPQMNFAPFMGRVNTDKMYDNVVNKFAWGNFDKIETFVDESYLPSTHSIQYCVGRLIEALLRQGDKERAEKVLDVMLAAFPPMNFPYVENASLGRSIASYYNIGTETAVQKADSQLKVFLTDIEEYIDFVAALSNPGDRKAFSKSNNYRQSLGGMTDAMRAILSFSKDDALKQQAQNLMQKLGKEKK